MTTPPCYALLAMLFAIPIAAHTQDSGFIYGKVYTDDGVYEGLIRWGKEEVYWCDMFNASKNDNAYIDYLNEEQLEVLEEKQNGYWFNWNNSVPEWVQWTSGNTLDRKFLHQFSCQFGELKTLWPTGSQRVKVEMKNGKIFNLDGEGYNDVGLDIRIVDKTMGEIEVLWSRIVKVEFIDTPTNLETRFGDPLWGTVEAYGKKFSGLIQWDKDERLSTDKLDGKGEDGTVSLEFGRIQSIEKRGNRSVVVLQSGRELILSGSNDVDSENRGVVVMNKDFPSIEIPWSEFKRVVFEKAANEPIARYSDFRNQGELQGVVSTREGKSFSGRIVYDLDEAHDFELLQGKEGEYEYSIPFHSIKQVTRERSQCAILLSDNATLTLSESQDVNEKHQGVVVFAGKEKEPTYITWEEIKEIRFE